VTAGSEGVSCFSKRDLGVFCGKDLKEVLENDRVEGTGEVVMSTAAQSMRSLTPESAMISRVTGTTKGRSTTVNLGTSLTWETSMAKPPDPYPKSSKLS